MRNSRHETSRDCIIFVTQYSDRPVQVVNILYDLRPLDQPFDSITPNTPLFFTIYINEYMVYTIQCVQKV